MVPALWHREIGNVLIQAERRGRITPAGLAVRVELLRKLPLDTEDEATGRAFAEILSPARARRSARCWGGQRGARSPWPAARSPRSGQDFHTTRAP